MDLRSRVAHPAADYGLPAMTHLSPFDVVRLPSGLAAFGIEENAIAVVLEVHHEPYLAYEIEVVDEAGRTRFAGAVDPATVELIEAFHEESD